MYKKCLKILNRLGKNARKPQAGFFWTYTVQSAYVV